MVHSARRRTRTPKRLLLGVTASLLATLTPPAQAAAFTGYESFSYGTVAATPDDGAPGAGGAGRFFTGAPGDGYTCAVCHQSERGSEPAVFGADTLPLLEEGWVPGQTYMIELTLLNPEGDQQAAAGVVEVTDNTGAPIGTMALPPPDAMDECDGGGTAVYLQGEEQGRQVAVSDSCGELRLRVEWTAPGTPTAGVRLYAATVLGDGDGLSQRDPAENEPGDLVQVAVRQLPVAGDAPEVMRVGNACAVSRDASPVGRAAWLLGAAALLWRRRRRP